MPPGGRRTVRRRARVAPALGALLLSAAALAGAAEWIVDDDGPADFDAIQDAVNAFYVQPGDTILVRPGLYSGPLYLGSKDLVIRSEAGPWVTVLDAQQMGSVVSLVNRSSATRIEGLTLRNGRDQTGGGVYIDGGAPVVTRNVIVGNSAVGGFLGYGYGGGIEIVGAAPVITRNVISGNTALDGGGGIDVYYSGPGTPGTCCPVISQNTLEGNLVTSAAGIGGGILSFASEPRVGASILIGNRAASGGGIYAVKPHGVNDEPDAGNNIVFANLPDAWGSDGSWRLPVSNRLIDPRLGDGDGIDLWPRSDSPALETAAGLPAGPDLSGYPSPVDSDLDGTPGLEIGALENRGEITGLRAAHDGAHPTDAVLSWDDSTNPAVVFNVYAHDDDPFRADGGFCLASSLAGTTLTDLFVPAAGRVRYYLVTGRGAIEGPRGFTSAGVARPPGTPCPGP